jgi:hypothetical protein
VSKFKHRLANRRGGVTDKARKLAHDLHQASYEQGLHNRKGQGALPSQLGWGQHKSSKRNVSLFDPFRSP